MKRGLKLFITVILTVMMMFSIVNVEAYASSKQLEKVKITSLKISDKKFTVKYKKVKNADGYQISYRKAGSSKWSNKNVSSKTTSVTIKNLTRGKKYYVKVRAYDKEIVKVTITKTINTVASSEEELDTSTTSEELDTQTNEEKTTTEETTQQEVSEVVEKEETSYGTYSTTKTANILSLRKIREQKVVQIAKSKLGCRYVYGATGPNKFDCSGLTKYVIKKATGKNIPRTSSAQKRAGKVVSLKNLKVGDIVWRPGHVGIYVGNGKVIHSPRPGKTVRYINVGYFTCGVRYF